MKLIIFFILLFALSINVSSQAPPVVKKTGRNVVSMNNMLGKVEGMKCQKSQNLTGTIVKRNYDESETMIIGFVLRKPNDERYSINLNEAQVGLLGRMTAPTLSSLLSLRKRVRVSIYECTGGGSGIFPYASSVTQF